MINSPAACWCCSPFRCFPGHQGAALESVRTMKLLFDRAPLTQYPRARRTSGAEVRTRGSSPVGFSLDQADEREEDVE